MTPSCADCKFNQPYSPFYREIRMCAESPNSVHTTDFARAPYGRCKPEGKFFEAKNDRTALQR